MSRALRWMLTFALTATVLAVSGASTFSQQSVAQRVDTGEQPASGPIIYDLLPADRAVIPQDELEPVRAGATIETRHNTSIKTAEVFIDGVPSREVALLGPYPYLQSATVDLKGLKPGKHEIRVVATDARGRTGGHTWHFTVAPADSTTYSRVVDNSDKVTTGRFDASTSWGNGS